MHNKLIKLNKPIKDPNLLLNKYILYKHVEGRRIILFYIYKTAAQTLYCYKISNDILNKIFYIDNYNTISFSGINGDLLTKHWHIYVF